MTSKRQEKRAVWTSPKLQELGHLKDFVRVGQAKGKSVVTNDGGADAGGESMTQND